MNEIKPLIIENSGDKLCVNGDKNCLTIRQKFSFEKETSMIHITPKNLIEIINWAKENKVID